MVAQPAPVDWIVICCSENTMSTRNTTMDREEDWSKYDKNFRYIFEKALTLTLNYKRVRL